MTIKEISSTLPDESGVHSVWEISIKGITIIRKRYGSFCGWNKITLEKDSEEIYRIEFKPHYEYKGGIVTPENQEDKGIRTEYFSGEFFRNYFGNQFSFVEYVELMDRKNSFPTLKDLKMSGLGRKFAIAYREKAKMIFDL